MSEPLFNDSDVFLLIRTKINNINDCFQVAETDVTITAGAVTSVPIVTLTKNLLPSGEKVTLVNKLTGEAIELTLSASAASGATALTITSHTFAEDITTGSAIYYKYTDLLASIY